MLEQEEPREEEELRVPQEEDGLQEECDDDQRQQEEKLFAQEYLLRVRLLTKFLLTSNSCVGVYRKFTKPFGKFCVTIFFIRCAALCKSFQMLLSSSCRFWITSLQHLLPQKLYMVV